jgi:hypothetical protein
VCHQWYDITNNTSYKNKCRKCYYKEYYQKNKEKLKQQFKDNYKKNKQRYKENSKKWKQNNKEKAKKSDTISDWKQKGLICDNYDQVYQLWLDSTHCDKCGCQYTNKNHKDMEHCHTTGAFRGIVCHKCNLNMLDKTKPTNNTSGHKNVSYDKKRNKYKYQKIYYGKIIRNKRFETLSDALCYKYIMLLRIRAGHFD